MKKIEQLDDHFINEEGDIFKLKKIKSNRYLWVIKEPSGNIVETKSLIDFCENKNITLSCLKKTFRGIRNHHKGYCVISRKPIKEILIKVNSIKIGRYKASYLVATNLNLIKDLNELVIIQHLDGNIFNNAPSNLMAVSPLAQEEKAVFLDDLNCYVTNKSRIFVWFPFEGWQENKQIKTSHDYLTTYIKGKNWLVHRLIATAFIDNPHGYETVNHINEIKTDNRIENLEWCTLQQNLAHSRYRMGRGRSLYKILKISTNEIFEATNLNYFCQEHSLTPKLLRHTFTRNKKKHKGFKIIERIEVKDKFNNYLHLSSNVFR